MSIEELPPDAPIPDGVANDEDKSEMSVSEPPESPKAGEGEAGLWQGNAVQPQKVYSRNLVGDLLKHIQFVPFAGRRKEKRKLAETPSMLDPSQLAAKKQQPSDDMKATSPAIVIVEEASSGAKSAGNMAENATCDASRGEQNATPTPKARTTPKNHRKKHKTTSAGSGVDRRFPRSKMAIDGQV